ncbi:MAG: SusC/RagA family TonB-linked outer membrane protein, partial [Chitinophagales bacterium]
MKFKISTHVAFSVLFFLNIIWIPAVAQTATITGNIIDTKQSAVPFATIQLQGTQLGASTEDDGSYVISGVPYGTYTLMVTYVGYKTYSQSLSINAPQVAQNITLVSDYLSLDEVVVVGYGTKQVKDLTGSVASVSSKDFNTGIVGTPEQLITGKVAGVQITSNSGAPGSGSRIRIRGGTSINATNDPLIVIDGVPVSNSGISGAANALNLINPDDIENITILKDASAAAIYGCRAANGVILITSKKGTAGGKFNIGFSTTLSVGHVSNFVPVLSTEEFRSVVDSAQQHLLGNESTDWQDEIYRTSISSDNNLSFSDGTKDVPYRISLGYLHEQGILKRSELKRTSAAINLRPSFFNNHLSVELNSRFAYTRNFFADQGAIGSAVYFDPTQPVYDSTGYGGYFEWLDISGNPNTLAPKNPVGLLYQKDDESEVFRYINNIQFDYKFHFLPDLRANLNLGNDHSLSYGTVFIPDSAASSFTRHGTNNQYSQVKRNKLLEFYLNYLKNIKSIQSKLELQAGYSYQDFFTASPIEPFTDSSGNDIGYPDINALGDTITPGQIPFKTENVLVSFYGRINYTLHDKYLLTLSLRDDGSSRFSPDTRWGLFPAAAVAWRISDEPFLKNSNSLSNLKLRLSYGQVGQQDIGNDYPYIANYEQGTTTAQYQFGGEYYYVLRPVGYDANIKWEVNTEYNAGLDFGFYNGRINGTLEIYKKLSSDLLAVIPVPDGTNFTNQIFTNVGSMENKGIEGTLNLIPFDTKNFKWEFSANATFNKNKITKLTKVDDSSSIGILVGGISGGIGNTIQIQSVGFPLNEFYAYQQIYDENGNPINATGNPVTDTTAFVDQNHDGKITPDDLIWLDKSPEPKVYLGFSSS